MALPPNASVLLIRLSAMGDVLFSLETLSSLKTERPDVQVDFLVEDRFASVLRGHPMIREILVYPRTTKLSIPAAAWRLRRRRYDAVLDLHGNTKSAVHARIARSNQRLGYAAPIAREGAERWYHRAIAIPGERPHRADQGYHLLRALGLRGDPARAVLPPPPSPAEPHDIVLHPGTSAFARFKRWPLSHFLELAAQLHQDGFKVAVSAGPGEAEIAAATRKETPQVTVLDGSELGLARMIGHYAAARVMVAADTGPLHLATAAGTKVIALFGPKNHHLYGPRGEHHTVLFHEVPCRPCTRRTCPAPICILGIRVDEVAEAVRRTMELTPS